jgi:hypothetical protein
MKHRSNLGTDEMDCSFAVFVRTVFAVQHAAYHSRHFSSIAR